MTPQNLDQYMDDFGDRLARATPPKRPRGKRLALGGVLLVAAATPLAILLPGGGGSPVNAIAQAREALDPKDSIVHLRFQVSSPDRNLGTSESEMWAAEDPESRRVKSTMNFPNGRSAVTEFAYAGDETHFYSPDRDVLTISRRPSGERADDGPLSLLGGDPAGELERMLTSGQITDAGDQQADGRTIHRFTGHDRGMDVVYDVDPETYAPIRIAMTYKDRPTVAVDVVEYERLKKTPANKQLLTIQTTRETKLTIFGRVLAERYAVSGGGITCERTGKQRYTCRHR